MWSLKLSVKRADMAGVAAAEYTDFEKIFTLVTQMKVMKETFTKIKPLLEEKEKGFFLTGIKPKRQYATAEKKKEAQERAKLARQSNKRKKPAEATANEADSSKDMPEVEVTSQTPRKKSNRSKKKKGQSSKKKPKFTKEQLKAMMAEVEESGQSESESDESEQD